MENTWDLTPLLKNDDDPQAEEILKKVKIENLRFIDKWKSREDYLKDPLTLKQALDEYEALKCNYGLEGGVGYYFWLRSQQDQSNPQIKAKYNKVQEFENKLANEIIFFTLNLSKISEETQEIFLAARELKPYRHFLETLFNESQYLLSEKEEKILILKNPVAYEKWVNLTEEFLSKEEKEVLTSDGSQQKKSFAEIMSLINHERKEVRDSAARSLNEILEKHVDLAETELNAVLGNKKIDDEIRGVQRPDVLRHLDDDISTSTVDVLIEAVSQRFNIPKRYYKLKANLMGVEKLGYHERNVEYGALNKEYSFKEAADLVSAVFSRLSLEFSTIFKNYLDKKQIDVFPQKGKTNGAFAAYHMKASPGYVLLNYADKLRDVLTLAHEFGHAIHHEFMKKQNALNIRSSKATAETASTFMEDFVIEKLSEGVDDELRLSLMMSKLNDDVSSIFRQIACYRFEQNLHQEFRQKGYLSKKEIGEMFQKHMADYMGEYVEQSVGSQNWWVYWSHIRAFFYNYSYASGLLISKYLQEAVKEDPSNIKKVEEFFSAGSSNSPEEIFKTIGLDITKKEFWSASLDKINNLLIETEDLAKKLKKI